MGYLITFLILYSVVLTIGIFLLESKMEGYNKRIHNVEVECFSPVAEVTIDKKKINRLTLCGAVKPIFDIIANKGKTKKPHLIIPGLDLRGKL